MSDDMFPGFGDRRIRAFGVEISARVGGDGPPLLLLHGFPQTHVMWHRVAPALAERFTVVAADLRGYGDSSCPPNDTDNFTYSKRAMARDMVQVMEELGHTVFSVAGHDRGGRVAYRMALDTPERVERLAVLDIVPTYAMWHGMNMARAMQVYHWMFLAQPEPLPEMLIGGAPVEYQDYTLASWTKTRDLAAFDPRALEAYRKFYAVPERIAATCHDYRAGQTYDLDADAADFEAGRRIGCPLLALWGDAGVAGKADQPLTVWQQWATDARGVAIDSGHFVAEENPQATLRWLMEFFSEGG